MTILSGITLRITSLRVIKRIADPALGFVDIDEKYIVALPDARFLDNGFFRNQPVAFDFDGPDVKHAVVKRDDKGIAKNSESCDEDQENRDPAQDIQPVLFSDPGAAVPSDFRLFLRRIGHSE